LASDELEDYEQRQREMDRIIGFLNAPRLEDFEAFIDCLSWIDQKESYVANKLWLRYMAPRDILKRLRLLSIRELVSLADMVDPVVSKTQCKVIEE